MKRYWMLAGTGLLAIGLAVGVTLAATGPGGPPQGGGPGGDGPPHMMGPGGPHGPMALDRDLETALGKALTDDQKKLVAEAAKTMHEAVRAAHEAFIKKVADATGLTVDKVREALPPPPPPGDGMRGPPRGDGEKGPPPPPARTPSGT